MKLHDCINKDDVYWSPQINWYIFIKSNKGVFFKNMIELKFYKHLINEYGFYILSQPNYDIIKLSPLFKLFHGIQK